MGDYADVNGLEMYYEVHGEGKPLILIHGGFGSTEMFSEILPELSEGRQVIAVDLQGHGRTADINRPLSLSSMADSVGALIHHLSFENADVMGYSLGGATALQTAVRHPDLVHRLVVISTVFKRDAWFPEALAGFDAMGRQTAEFTKQSPAYKTYASVAPRPVDWPLLWEKMGEMLREDYDWTEDVSSLEMPTLFVCGDADGFPPSHAAEFYGLLGGGKADPGFDTANLPASRLAILPATTHYNILSSPLLVSVVNPFLD